MHNHSKSMEHSMFRIEILLILLFLTILFIQGCGCKSYECRMSLLGEMMNNEKCYFPKIHTGGSAVVLDKDNKECTKKCGPKECSEGRGYASCIRKRIKESKLCFNSCYEEKYPPLAEHIENGYYSDGSYYARCQNSYENIHPKKDEYSKTEWQKARDDCIQITAKNVNKVGYQKQYYLDCLNERGYLN